MRRSTSPHRRCRWPSIVVVGSFVLLVSIVVVIILPPTSLGFPQLTRVTIGLRPEAMLNLAAKLGFYLLVQADPMLIRAGKPINAGRPKCARSSPSAAAFLPRSARAIHSVRDRRSTDAYRPVEGDVRAGSPGSCSVRRDLSFPFTTTDCRGHIGAKMRGLVRYLAP
jgi:hypothetical protein